MNQSEKMKHPKSEDIYKVAERFRSVEHMPGTVDMKKTTAFEEPCGTVACMAGWYYLTLKEEDLKEMPSIIVEAGAHDAYSIGAKSLAYSLGFSNKNLLRDWAIENPDLWGNEFGASMFSHELAYGKESSYEILTVKEIADHFFGVANRLKTMEDVGVLVPEQIDGSYGRLETHWKDGSVTVTTVEDREKNE